MKLTITQFVEIIGISSVVISLLFVAFEIQQSNRIAVVTANQTRTSDIQDLDRELALSEDLAIILVKLDSNGAQALSPVEFMRARSWFDLVLRGMQGQYYQYQQGFLERAVIDRTLEDIFEEGIYQKWESLQLLENIEIEQWQKEIEDYRSTMNTEDL